MDCNYPIPIDLALNGLPFAVLNHSVQGNCNPTLVRIDQIQEEFLRVQNNAGAVAGSRTGTFRLAVCIHTEKSFPNLIISTQNQIVFTM